MFILEVIYSDLIEINVRLNNVLLENIGGYMKKLLLVVMTVLFVSACSSTGDRASGTAPEFEGDPGFSNPINSENPIEDKGYTLVDDQIFHDGELLGTIEGGVTGDGLKNVTAPDGGTIAKVQNEYSDMWTVYMIDPEDPHAGGGDIYKIDTSHGEIKIDWANSTIDGRYGNDAVPPSPELASTSVNPKNIGSITKANIRAKIKARR